MVYRQLLSALRSATLRLDEASQVSRLSCNLTHFLTHVTIRPC